MGHRGGSHVPKSTNFVELMLCVTCDSLSEILATEQVRVQVTVQVEKLIEAIGTETLSARELMQRLGLTHRPSFAKNYINPALSLGLITMTVPEKPNSSKQRYKKRI